MTQAVQEGYRYATIREAVGVFKNQKALEAGIDDLLTHGFDRALISLLATDKTVEKELGHAYEKVQVLEDDPHVPRVAYISRDAVGDAEGAALGGLMYVGAVGGTGLMVASGGSLALTIAAAATGLGYGVLLGGLLAYLIGRVHADYLADQLDKGGLLLWVRTLTPEMEEKAKKILSANGATDVHVHNITVPTWQME